MYTFLLIYFENETGDKRAFRGSFLEIGTVHRTHSEPLPGHDPDYV